MIRVALELSDPINRLTLQSILERAGHKVGPERPDVIIADHFEDAVAAALTTPTLVLAGFNQIPQAVDAMHRGVWGYILLPFQPGEAELMVRRAVEAGTPIAAFQPRTLEDVEVEHILAMIRHCKGNRAKAARLLGIGRNTLWRKLASVEQSSTGGSASNK